MKLRFLQLVNKTSCHTEYHVQQGKHPPINIQIFLITCMCLFPFKIWSRSTYIIIDCIILLYFTATTTSKHKRPETPIRGNWFVA